MFAPSLFGGEAKPKEFPTRVPERDAEVIDLNTAHESARFDFERVERLKNLVQHTEEEEFVQMDAHFLAELADIFSPPATRSLRELSELKRCLFQDGRLWLAELLDRASSAEHPIALFDSHLVTTKTPTEFIYSTCVGQDCDEIGAHGAEDWLSLPLLQAQPLAISLDHHSFNLQPSLGVRDRNERRAEEYEAEETKLFAENLGQIFHTLSVQSRRVQDEAFAWDA